MRFLAHGPFRNRGLSWIFSGLTRTRATYLGLLSPLTTPRTDMISRNLRALQMGLLSLFAMAFVSCGTTAASLGIPPVVSQVLTQVTGFSGNIADWKSGLGGVLDQAGMGQLKGYVDQAGQLGETVTGLTDGLGEVMADPMKAIGNKLTEMGGLDVNSLKSMVPADQLKAVDGFADSASSLSDMTNGFLKQFGN